MKFLGAHIFHNQQAKSVLKWLKEDLRDRLRRVDELLVRDEYKINIYRRYLLPSLRFALTVHDLHRSHLRQLDQLTARYLKKWAHMPRGASLAMFHDPKLLNIKSVSHLYQETRTLAYAKQAWNPDRTVEAAIESKRAREGTWTRKSSTINEAHERLTAAIEATPAPVTEKAVVATVRRSLNEEIASQWRDKLEQYVMQGQMPLLFHSQEADSTWLSTIFNMPRGLVQFALNASLNTLPSADNLRRWGKRISARCLACRNGETLFHVLNGCTVYLQQGRYTWRHNSVLLYIYNTLSELLQQRDGYSEVLVDLPGYQQGNTIPADVIPTNQIPDLVVLDRENRRITIFELTVPFETNLTQSEVRKVNKYAALVADVEATGFECQMIHLTVGSRGLVTTPNRTAIEKLMPDGTSKGTLTEIYRTLNKIALSASYSIFYARLQPTWRSPPLLNYKL